jgi:prefoldin subunit 5
MAGEPEETLPDELRRWVDEQAAASDEDPEDVLSRAVTLYRLVEDHATSASAEMPPVDDIETELERLTDQVSALDDRLEAVEGGFDDRVRTVEEDLTDRVGSVEESLTDRVGVLEEDVDEKVTDLRERVIQVKREADAKAPADHDHEELRTRVDRLGTRVDDGFENYEEVLTYLTDETDDLDDKVTRLASVVVSLRERTARVERRVTRVDAAADLKESANRHGMTKAKCGACGGSVGVGLLTEPACPHCERGFVGVEPAGRLFRSGTLVTGSAPALMAGDDPDGESRNGHGRHEHADAERESEGEVEPGSETAAAGLLEESRND